MPQNLTVTAGQTIRFPVPSNHPLAPFQALKNVSEVPNIHELPIAREIVAKRPTISAADLTLFLNRILNGSQILVFTAANLTVAQGATLVLSNPINTITANDVVIAGELRSYGSLSITCVQIGG
jgi:hypothetical protein